MTRKFGLVILELLQKFFVVGSAPVDFLMKFRLCGAHGRFVKYKLYSFRRAYPDSGPLSQTAAESFARE